MAESHTWKKKSSCVIILILESNKSAPQVDESILVRLCLVSFFQPIFREQNCKLRRGCTSCWRTFEVWSVLAEAINVSREGGCHKSGLLVATADYGMVRWRMLDEYLNRCEGAWKLIDWFLIGLWQILNNSQKDWNQVQSRFYYPKFRISEGLYETSDSQIINKTNRFSLYFC